MSTPFEHIKESRTAKLIIALGSPLIIGDGISWSIVIDTARKNLLNDAILAASKYR
jgi:hypothetical protein